MSTYQEKLARLNQDIKQNGLRQITGPVLNAALKYMLDPNVADVDMNYQGTIYTGNVYTKVQVNNLLQPLKDRIQVLEEQLALQSEYQEDEKIVASNMIFGGQVTFTPSELVNKDLEHTLYYNGVFMLKSIYSIDNNNLVTINLALLGVEPKVGDSIAFKYYK